MLSSAVPQHSIELGFGYRELVRHEALRSTGYWWAGCRFDVVYRVVAHLPQDSRGACEIRELGQEIIPTVYCSEL